MSPDPGKSDPASPDPEGADRGRSNLERRYRALLRVLPAWYRQEREEEMVDTFLADRTDGLDLEYGWPGWGEVGATVGLAVRVRFGARRPAGAVVRLVALTGLLAQLVAGAQSWTVSALSALSATPGFSSWSPWEQQRWWYDPLTVVAFAAFAALVSGRRAVGRVVAGLLGVAGLVPVLSAMEVGFLPWLTVLWQLPVWATVAAVLLGFHREAPPVPRLWWATVPVGLLAGVVSVLFILELSVVTMLVAWLIAAVAAVVVVVRPWTARVPTATDPTATDR
ncbi:hypothetical protein ALI22I_23735 [Saccharothrix sp. ALI-22-I]|uniref:hypothetical protein n=1 Tax=Saccharothrix sp. ALI-22-I TaxID=1933778 RepID=UPI00097C68F0|nr:hypothetical protein [Saccharothrix sp. ALI-22-I]ONI86650.1 hypothetical protein ALI22I_23735 [Saccharothrix sp. ALI-22-I]